MSGKNQGRSHEVVIGNRHWRICRLSIVYVGSVSARLRDGLWERITDTIGSGRATMAFSTNGEQKYDFYFWNPEWEPVDFDGIKLIRRKLSTRHEVRSPAARTSGSKPSETTGMNPTRGLFDNTEDHPDYTVILILRQQG